MRRATNARPETRRPCAISIHALLAESDNTPIKAYNIIKISIHALLAESDFGGRIRQRDELQFLSTLSLRRATLYINRTAETIIFLSTLSLRRATGGYGCAYLYLIISIHALLAESDGNKCCKSSNDSDFYPRSPCGERLNFPAG